MNAFVSFLAYVSATLCALVALVASIIAIASTVKKDRKIVGLAVKVFVLFLAIALLIVTVQYAIQSETPPSTPTPVENTQPAISNPPATPSKDSVTPQNSNDDDKASIPTGDNNVFAQGEGNANSAKDSVTAQNSGNNSNVVTVAGNNNTIVQGENNTIINGSNNIITPSSTETPVTVSSVVLNKEYVDLTVNDTLTLTATVLYSNNEKDSAVIWTSSDTAIVRVDEAGNITALAPGTAKIIAQATKNNSAKAAQCEIHVITVPSGYSISLSTDTTTLYSPFRIYITPNEENATQIQVHAKAPSGHIDNFVWNKDMPYQIETETGTWTIWATIENKAGSYTGNQASDFATIEVTPLTFDAFLSDSIIP